MLEKFKPLHVANTHSPTRRCHVRLRERNTNPKRRGLAARRGVRPGPRARCERVTRLGAQRVGSAPPPATRPALRCFLARRRGPALPRGAPRLLGAALLHPPPVARAPPDRVRCPEPARHAPLAQAGAAAKLFISHFLTREPALTSRVATSGICQKFCPTRSPTASDFLLGDS